MTALPPTADTACFGGLADLVEAAIQEMSATPSEISHASSWLECASGPVVDALSVAGRFAASKTAEAEFLAFATQTADWAHGVWRNDPMAMVAPDVMVATLLVSMAAADYEFASPDEDDHVDWLWSPFGPPMRGNSARFEERDRCAAHISLLSATAGRPGLDPRKALAEAETHAASLIAAEVENLDGISLRRSQALDRLGEELSASAANGSTRQETVDALMEVFDTHGEAIRATLLASASDASFPLDAYGWASMTARQVVHWSGWVRNAIDGICDGEDDLDVRFSCWSAADLLMRVLAYETIHANDEAAALHLAHDLLGRAPQASPQ